jgi:tRNA-Thr(GGU) m(6)t(6)A37 methyltransferase TsaA
MSADLILTPIGTVESGLTDPGSAPNQGDEGAPEAVIVFDAALEGALEGIEAGDELVVLTWLHLARRDVLRVHPRGDIERPLQGVFNTRSPDRPNPIGMHRVQVVAVERATTLRVSNLEAVHGTPVIDVKPVLSRLVDER